MSSANIPTLSQPEPELEPEPEQDLGQLECHRGSRVHVGHGSHLPSQPHAQVIGTMSAPDHYDAFPRVSHTESVNRSSNECMSPQRFTNPFNGGECEADNPMSSPALDGVTLYRTQLPVYGSGTLTADLNDLKPNQKVFGMSQSEAPLPRDRYLWSSFQHPYDIEPPSRVYNDATFGPEKRLTLGTLEDRCDSASGGPRRSLPPRYSMQDPIDVSLPPMPRRFRGGFANMLELWRVSWQQVPDQSEFVIPHDTLFDQGNSRPWMVRSQSSFGYDPDDPKITGTKKVSQDDPEDAESQCRQQMNLQYMSYRQRRKEAQRIKIQFNVTCKFPFLSLILPTPNFLPYSLSAILSRQQFIMKLARCLMAFGAPSHRIESQLVAAARILEVDAEFIHLPNLIIVCFGDPETKTSETHFLRCSGRLALGSLHKVHRIYRRVVHDEMSARKATEELMRILESKPIYGLWTRCFIAFWLSALICPLAFGGSFLDMFIAGFGAFVLSALQLTVVMKSSLYANVFE
jgi:Putative threonine/serine exporter